MYYALSVHTYAVVARTIFVHAALRRHKHRAGRHKATTAPTPINYLSLDLTPPRSSWLFWLMRHENFRSGVGRSCRRPR